MAGTRSYPDPFHQVSVKEAARRLGFRVEVAIKILRRAGIVQVIEGQERVWLADLRTLGQAAGQATSPATTPKPKEPALLPVALPEAS